MILTHRLHVFLSPSIKSRGFNPKGGSSVLPLSTLVASPPPTKQDDEHVCSRNNRHSLNYCRNHRLLELGSAHHPSTLSSVHHYHHHYEPRQSQPQQQHRHFHATPRQEIVVPLMAVVLVGGAWVAYRYTKGQSLMPDQALAAEEAYRKQEEKLKAQQEKYKDLHQQHQADKTTKEKESNVK